MVIDFRVDLGDETVTVRRTTTTVDNRGNSTDSESSVTVDKVLFEPAQPVPRTDSRSPGVVTPAKFYFCGTAMHLDADDEIDYGGYVWSVIGGSSVWGTVGTEVPVQRTSAV